MEKTKFYIIEESCGSSQVGPVYPQISKMMKGYDYEATDSVHAVSRLHNEIPDFEPNFNYFILNGKSKLSDFLSFSVMTRVGFIVSSKVKNILENCTLPEHKFFTIKVLYKNVFIEDYYWLHIVCDLSKNIDFPKSKFEIFDKSTFSSNTIVVNSRIELENLKLTIKESNKGSSRLSVSSLKFSLNTTPSYDLFEFKGVFDYDFYISENLKEIFFSEKITGIECILSNKL